jgi:hypothetical protein
MLKEARPVLVSRLGEIDGVQRVTADHNEIDGR